ncbi:hypothetical protein [Mucilaginibacter sp.]|uniref:hypothetical protein n=1 Tax=Mucilaginibacter sp. TaxID=1882438 RepID=UPI0032666A15
MMQANWTYIVIGLCILLAAVLVWQEVRRTSKKWLVLRIMAVLAASVMLACIALPVAYHQVDAANEAEKVILLTDGFSADSLNNAVNRMLFTLDKDVKKGYPKAILLSGIDELADTLKAQTLHVYGRGLSDAELEQFTNTPLVFHPSVQPGGVAHISWNPKLKTGSDLRVQGSYNNPSAQPVQLLLKGLNTILDTVTIKPHSQSNFELTATPKITGRVVYSLQSVINGDTLTEGSIPLQVEAVMPLKVLMLSASPDFETKFLKNWLGQNGYGVAARSAISKDKYSSEFINIPQVSLERLSASSLNKFDVVIGGLSAFGALSSADAAALKQEVENNGLGIIARADSAGKTLWLQKDFPLEKPVGKETVSPLIVNGKKSASAQLNTGNQFIRYQNGTQPLVATPQNHILAGSTIAGWGKLVFTTLDNTYSWTLGGNQRDYSALWSALISSAARQDTSLQNTITALAIPVVGEPVQIQLVNNKAPSVLVNGEAVAAAQNMAVPFERNATYWPGAQGWQSVQQNNTTAWFYAYHNGEWEGVKAATNIAATTNYAEAHTPGGIVTKQIQQKLRIEVPKIYFYILLLAACTFLWVEKKLS